MTKVELLALMKARLHEHGRYEMTQSLIAEALTVFRDIVIEELKKPDGEVSFWGLGKLKTRTLPPRICRNPHTGEKFEKPARRKAFLTMGKRLRDAINTD